MTMEAASENQYPEDNYASGVASSAEKGQPALASDISNDSSSHRWEQRKYYNWRTFWKGGDFISFLGWLRSGFSGSRETDEEMNSNLVKLAMLLSLLRDFWEIYGMPEEGGPVDQEYVLRSVTKALYSGGTPIWTLGPAMERAAEGLTGKRGVDFFILPRKAFICAPSSGVTTMFRIDRGYDIHMLNRMEKVLVTIASYASNTHGVSSLPTRVPSPEELLRAKQEALLTATSMRSFCGTNARKQLASSILRLASRAEGIFFFINSIDRPDDLTYTMSKQPGVVDDATKIRQFWEIENHIAELFSRLATIDAIRRINKIEKDEVTLYSRHTKAFFQFMTSAGAAIFWFQGGWIDMAVAGFCGFLVAYMKTAKVFTREERIIMEGIASLFVGIIAGVVSFLLPEKTCFGAIGLGGIVNILQGFRMAFAVVELMGKQTVSGGADFLEGLLFTTLIALSLRVGQQAATKITGTHETQANLHCTNGVNELWYLLLLPLSAFAWSALFNPSYSDLPLMAFHGILAFAVTWGAEKGGFSSAYSLYFAAMAVTLSAGFLSRFIGRQALGNTVAGLYALVPGSYLTKEFFTSTSVDAMGMVFFKAALIGIGAWTGTLLCSPTILGTTVSLLRRQTGIGRHSHFGRRFRASSPREHERHTMLLF